MHGHGFRINKKKGEVDFSLLDAEVDRIVWMFSVPRLPDEIHRRRTAEEEILLGSDQERPRYWLATSMMLGEAFLLAPSTYQRRSPVWTPIDFIKNRQLIAEGKLVDTAFMEQVLGKPGQVRKVTFTGGKSPFFLFQTPITCHALWALNKEKQWLSITSLFEKRVKLQQSV